MIYQPDFRALSNQQARALFPPPPENVAQVPVLDKLEAIAALIAVEMYNFLINNPEPDGFGTAGLYTEWLKRLVEEHRSDRIVEVKKLYPPQRLQMLQDLYRETDHLVETKALKRLHDRMADILQHRMTGDDISVEGGLLADFYDNSLCLTGVHAQIAQVFNSVSHANPNLRILELKGGRGQTGRVVLRRP